MDEINSEKRQDIEREINDTLRAIFLDKGFALDRFVLRNVAFSPEFAAAVERKQVEMEGVMRSEHEASQVRLVAEGQADATRSRAQAEAEAIRVKAEAEAEALRMIGAALDENPDLLNYRYIDKLSPNIKVMLVPNDAPYILPVDGIDGAAPVAPTAQPAPPTTGDAPPAAPTAAPLP